MPEQVKAGVDASIRSGFLQAAITNTRCFQKIAGINENHRFTHDVLELRVHCKLIWIKERNSSYRRMPVSISLKMGFRVVPWIPACAGMTTLVPG